MPKTLAFLDFEASGYLGFPIEVGWVVVDCLTGAELDAESHLIAHAPHWEADYGWAAEAEEVHGISRATLAAEGVSAAVVARHVAARFGSGGKDAPPVISDAVPHDQRWMDILLAAAGVSPNNRVRVHGFSTALALGPVDEAAYAGAVRWMQAQPVQHRALADARLVAEVYRRSLGPAR